MKIDQKLNDLNLSIVLKVSFYPCYHYIYIELSVDNFQASYWPGSYKFASLIGLKSFTQTAMSRQVFHCRDTGVGEG